MERVGPFILIVTSLFSHELLIALRTHFLSVPFSEIYSIICGVGIETITKFLQ